MSSPKDTLIYPVDHHAMGGYSRDVRLFNFHELEVKNIQYDAPVLCPPWPNEAVVTLSFMEDSNGIPTEALSFVCSTKGSVVPIIRNTPYLFAKIPTPLPTRIDKDSVVKWIAWLSGVRRDENYIEMIRRSRSVFS